MKKLNLKEKLGSETVDQSKNEKMVDGTVEGVSYETMKYVRNLRHPR